MNGNLLSTSGRNRRRRLLDKVVLVALGVLLLAVSAKVQVPFWPVPMTLQTLVVLLIGATYGARLGGAHSGQLSRGWRGRPAGLCQRALGSPTWSGRQAAISLGFLVAAVAAGLPRR